MLRRTVEWNFRKPVSNIIFTAGLLNPELILQMPVTRKNFFSPGGNKRDGGNVPITAAYVALTGFKRDTHP
jgi:hypothetical protein